MDQDDLFRHLAAALAIGPLVRARPDPLLHGTHQ